MKNLSLPGVIILVVASSAGNAQAPIDSGEARVRGVAGCYHLMVGDWSPVDINAAYHRLPPLIQLDTAHTAFGRGRMLKPNIAYPYHGAMPGSPNWNIIEDTLRLLWSDGFQPTIVKLVSRDSVWAGEAIAESDAHPMPSSPLLPRASVLANRTPYR